jgi:hypothetical protein
MGWGPWSMGCRLHEGERPYISALFLAPAGGKREGACCKKTSAKLTNESDRLRDLFERSCGW